MKRRGSRPRLGRAGRQLHSPLWRASVEDEVTNELAFHLEMTTRALMEHGMTEREARAEAERRFGNRATIDAECRKFAHERDRHERTAEYRDELRQDVGFAVRQLLKAPAFTLIAVATLALGIGATAAVFSVLNAVVLRPLPVDHPERVMVVYPTQERERRGASAPEFLALRDVAAFDHVAASIGETGVTMKLGALPEMISADRVSAEYFDVFGIKPELGRTFTADEDAPGHDAVVVLSHTLWMSHFDGDRGVIGRRISLDGTPHVIIGVLPASFDLSSTDDQLLLPLALTPRQRTAYFERYFQLFARLRPGVTIQQAQAAAGAAERRLAEQTPGHTGSVANVGVALHPFVDSVVGNYRSLLLILLGAVSFVLLIACSNVANLLLARGASRAKELAIRAALGAGRGRLVRQLLTESLVLATIGSAAGLGIAVALVRLIVAVSPADVPRIAAANIDWRVLVFTLTIGAVSSVVFGLLPAMRAAGPRLEWALREGGRGSRMGRDGLRGVLVTAEVALAMMLLVGSGLLIRSAWLMEHVDPGFDTRGVLTARLVLPAARYPDGAAITRLFEQARAEAARIPGVRSASLVLLPPFSGSRFSSSVELEGARRDSKTLTADLRLASAGYFETMGIPLRAGRDLSAHDDASAPLVVVVNEALVRSVLHTSDARSALGRRISAMTNDPNVPHLMTIVGVVGDIRDASLDEPPQPEFYAPMAQAPEMLWPIVQRSMVLMLKARNTGVDPDVLVRPLRATLARIDPSLPIADARSMDSFRKSTMETARMTTLLLATLGGIALVLAMVGIYGVVSFFVSQRTQEIGVRIALGATPGRVWQFVMRRGLGPIVVGVAIGLGLSSIATSVLESQLYHVTAHDPMTFGGVGGILLVVAIMAMYLPARRAMRVPPVVALTER